MVMFYFSSQPDPPSSAGERFPRSQVVEEMSWCQLRLLHGPHWEAGSGGRFSESPTEHHIPGREHAPTSIRIIQQSPPFLNVCCLAFLVFCFLSAVAPFGSVYSKRVFFYSPRHDL